MNFKVVVAARLSENLHAGGLADTQSRYNSYPAQCPKLHHFLQQEASLPVVNTHQNPGENLQLLQEYPFNTLFICVCVCASCLSMLTQSAVLESLLYGISTMSLSFHWYCVAFSNRGTHISTHSETRTLSICLPPSPGFNLMHIHAQLSSRLSSPQQLQIHVCCHANPSLTFDFQFLLEAP